MGMAHHHNINAACRKGQIQAQRGVDGRSWEFTGAALLAWRKTKPEHTRFDMRAKLAGMRIRQLNEITGDIQWSHVVNAVISGVKPVFEVIAGDFTVAGSADHRILTPKGWSKIGELKPGDMIVVRKFGKRDEDKTDPLRLKKIDGVWRSKWQQEQRAHMIEQDPLCRRCRNAEVEDIHHLEPVYLNPSRAFDPNNITALCKECHEISHSTQGWQGGTYLYGAAVVVEEVLYRGEEQTYDLEISGEFPNFLANGVVVHNSRNSASSRAIPVEKMIQRVVDDPYVPEEWGRNGRGMQAHGVLDEDTGSECLIAWLTARDHAVEQAQKLLALGVHKQTTNRLLEPFMWHTIVVTATEWGNFLNLRCHPDAHPAIRQTALAMREVLDKKTPIEAEWHLPFVDERDANLALEDKIKVSIARCARVSYLTHDGKRDIQADLALHDRLLSSGHMSPFEHVAQAENSEDAPCRFSGNFRGWVQYRKTIPNEANLLAQKNDHD
jgi:thymidylate synthase ThyX